MVQGAILKEDFAVDRPVGGVIGSRCVSGHERLGVDLERVLSIDNAALRIAPLVEAGFGRVALAYGPFERRPGLAFGVYALNGHNTAQAEPLSDTFRYRVQRWLSGSEHDQRLRRLMWWLFRGRIRRFPRQLRWWWRTSAPCQVDQRLDENLAAGWFPASISKDPRIEGSAFVMSALGPENGELWVGERSCRTRALRGVQNIPIYFVAVIRDGGVVFYVSSISGARDLPPYPWLRPVGIQYSSLSDSLYVGLQQGVIGQVGFRLDSRVYGVRVAQLPNLRGVVWRRTCGGSVGDGRDTIRFLGGVGRSLVRVDDAWPAGQLHDWNRVSGESQCWTLVRIAAWFMPP